jgi:hypothetical protein
MKKSNFLILGVSFLLFITGSCMKDNNGADYSVIEGEKVKIKNTLELSQAYNDTLIMVFDTAKVHRYNHFCMKYDTLYHQNDSMFSMHYSMFGDEMYKNGIMINNYSPSNNMMQGRMMNSGSKDMNRMMADTAIAGNYFKNMQELHLKHHIYHTGIYN